jgi:ribosomal protein S27E
MNSEKSPSLRGRLNRLTVRCPDCRQVWLAPGLAGGDEYACKQCGTVFLKRRAVVTRRRCEV